MSFITLAELKDELSITVATEDTKLQRAVDASNAIILQMFRLRRCEPDAYQSFLDVFDEREDVVALPSYPVIGQPTVVNLINSSTVPTSDYYVRNYDRLTLTGRGSLHSWPVGRRVLQVDYVAGWEPGDPAFASLKMAAMYIAMASRATSTAIATILSSGGAVKKEKHWDYEIEFFDSSSGSSTGVGANGGAIPEAAQTILDQWVRVIPSSN